MQLIGEKIDIAQQFGLKLVISFGETLDERKRNQTNDVVFRQVKAFGGEKTSFKDSQDSKIYSPKV